MAFTQRLVWASGLQLWPVFCSGIMWFFGFDIDSELQPSKAKAVIVSHQTFSKKGAAALENYLIDILRG